MPHDAKGVYNAFKERNINYASADSRVVNADQVSKLLRLLRRADEANVIPELQQMQYVNGQVTWCGRWSLATRLLGVPWTLSLPGSLDTRAVRRYCLALPMPRPLS